MNVINPKVFVGWLVLQAIINLFIQVIGVIRVVLGVSAVYLLNKTRYFFRQDRFYCFSEVVDAFAFENRVAFLMSIPYSLKMPLNK